MIQKDIKRNNSSRPKSSTTATAASPSNPQNPNEEKAIRINGFQQVVDMLGVADPQFRNSLLKRLQASNPELAYSLKNALRIK